MKATRRSFRDVLLDRGVLLRLGYLVVLMTLFNWTSHGTQASTPRSCRRART